jgi:hypothetical protein
MIALAFLVLFGLAIPPLLQLGATNLLTTSRLQEQRTIVYAADGATDGALQYLRAHPGCGRPFQTASSCPIRTGSSTSQFSATVGGRTATTTITATGAPLELDRSVTLSTQVDGAARVNATAVLRDSQTVGAVTEPPVDVKTWKYVR